MIWYIEQEGQSKKIPEETLVYKIQNGELGPDVLVTNEILKTWTPLWQTEIWKENCPVQPQDEEFAPPPIPAKTDYEEPSVPQTAEPVEAPSKRQSSKTGKWLVKLLVIAVVLIGVMAGLYHWWMNRQCEEKIESYIEYAKENLPGLWVNRNSINGDEYWEIYSNGTIVVYSQSAQITGTPYVAITTYGTWSILNIEDMTKETYQLQMQFLTESENPKVIQQVAIVQDPGQRKYRFECEFMDKDTIQRDNILLYRIGEEPEITESAVGLYIGEIDKRMYFTINSIDGNAAIYNWRYWDVSNGDLYEPYGYEGICEILPNTITLRSTMTGIIPGGITFDYGNKQLFSQYDFDLFAEVAPPKGSGTYKKISDFSAMLERETFTVGPAMNNIPQDETVSDCDAATLPPNDNPSLIPEVPASSGHALPYLIWTTEEVPIYTGPGTDYAYSKSMAPGVYTIVEESTGQGAILWGKLKSGAGWIVLDHIRLQDGNDVLETS